MDFSYKFYAVEGQQAYRKYYIAMVPLKLLSKLIVSDTEYVTPEFRAQRKINETRIPEIKNYIIDNRDNYVFSALSSSIDGKYEFNRIEGSVGILEIDMEATLLINDGQHRKAAIIAAMEEDPSLGEETISIVFFEDLGLERSQQMFTDLNKHAVRTSNSLATLYDSRDDLAIFTKRLIDEIEFFSKYTDKEKDILGKNSSKLFTLNRIYKSNNRILHRNNLREEDYEFIVNYWNLVTTNIVEWNELMKGEITKRDLRENHVITLSLVIESLGKLGRYFYENKEINMKDYLVKLRTIDWSRSNKDWIGRVFRENGKVFNSEESINLTYIKIKQLIGLPLSKEEKHKNNKI